MISAIKDSKRIFSQNGGGSGGSSGGGITNFIASGTDTYTGTVTGVTSYSDGDSYIVRFTNGNTTACTLNINSLGAIQLYRNNDGPLIGGDIVANAEMLCVYNSALNVFQAIGTAPNTLLAYVTNDDSVTLTKGMPVYAFSGTGDRMTVKRANNTSDATSAQTVGLVLSASIAANQKGLIMMQGLLDGLSILPTATWADGDAVYLGATDGSITNIKPSAPNHLVYLGVVTTASNGSSGRMYVRVQNGYELQELHNVSINAGTLADNQVLTYESATQLWKNKTTVPNVQTVTSAATVTPTSANDEVVITAQAVGLTLANPTGTPSEGQAMTIRIKDNGTSQTINYDTQYRAVGITLPTATTISKTLYLGLIYNSTDTKWDVVGVSLEGADPFYDSGWVDYSATSTIVGWSSFTNKVLKYRVIGKQVFVTWFLAGTSNSTSVTFTLPQTIASSCANMGYGIDNGVASGVGYIVGGATTSTITQHKTDLSGSWTASGSKRASGQIFFEIA